MTVNGCRFVVSSVVWSVYENSPAGTVVGTLEARGGAGVRYALAGGAGLFLASPSSGVLLTAAPLDYELQTCYNLTVTAINMVRVLTDITS